MQLLCFFKSFPEFMSCENRVTLAGPSSVPFPRALTKIHHREAEKSYPVTKACADHRSLPFSYQADHALGRIRGQIFCSRLLYHTICCWDNSQGL